MLIERRHTSRRLAHRVLIGVGCLMLFLPSATTNLFGDGLSGYEPSSPAPEASLRAWWDGDWQSAADQWWKERFGMRFFFVRLNNQVNYSIFGRVYKGGKFLVFGKEDWLYEKPYVYSYCRMREASSEESVRSGFADIRELQAHLDEYDVPFVVLLSPSKAASYPEKIPDTYCEPHESQGYDYELYVDLLDEYGIRYVDGHKVIESAKPLWPQITLFSRGGTHWNDLGAYYAAEALLSAIRPLSSKPIPPLVLEDVVVDQNPEGFDRDLVDFFNLFFPDTNYPVPHSTVSMTPSKTEGLRFALVGTSFLQQISSTYVKSGGFQVVDHYWYYHHKIIDAMNGESTPVDRSGVDWAERLLQADAIVLDLLIVDLEGEHARRFAEDGLAHFANRTGGDEPGR